VRLRPGAALGLWIVMGLRGGLEGNLVAHLGRTSIGGTGRQLQRPARAKYHRRQPPWLQASVDPDDAVAAPDENDVDREPHEEHVHPHERREAPVVEEHPGARIESGAPEQAATAAADTAGALQPGA